MKKLVLIACLASTAAIAGDAWRAGRDGTVTAYEVDGKTVIDNKQCFRTGRFRGYDYVSCGSRLRDEVKRELCSRLGSGTHYWFYQVGNSKPMKSSTYCPR